MKIVAYSQAWNPFWNVPEDRLNKLRQLFPEITVAYPKKDSDLIEEIKDADIFLGYKLDPSHLASAKELKWAHIPAANVSQFISPEFVSRKILLTNSRAMHATPVAEHIMGCMIVFSRKFMETWTHQQNGHYGAFQLINEGYPLSELRGKNLYIIGLGGIGKETARLAKAFGMNVLASRRKSSKAEENVDELFDAENFRDGLRNADYVVLSLPLTKESRGLIGERELSLLKPECVLINVARSGVLDTNALIKYLHENRIRGASLDVFDQEPLPENAELFSVPNLFLTPHVSGVAAQEHWDRMFWLFQENMRRFLSGKTLLNVVDTAIEY
jgi:phosphoglycerate dehydrogenase-like enzyme